MSYWDSIKASHPLQKKYLATHLTPRLHANTWNVRTQGAWALNSAIESRIQLKPK